MKGRIKKLKENSKNIKKIDVFRESCVNFALGFCTWAGIAFAANDMFVALAIAILAQRKIDSYVINRPAYRTWVGKWIIFPYPMWLGSLAGYLFYKMIAT